jgi:hypothetical protein
LGEVAVAAGVTAAVVVSDFYADDDPATIPALQKRLAASGLSVAVVPVTASISQPTIDDVVRLTGATQLDPGAAGFGAKLGAFVSSVASRAKASAYRFSYRVPPDQQANQATRSVGVSLAARASVTAATTYQDQSCGGTRTAPLHHAL